MRVCRVCLSLEEAEPFKELLQDDCRTAIELFDLFGINVVECSDVSAIICSKCSNDVSEAARLKKIALVADTFFRKQSHHSDEAQFSTLKESLESTLEVFELVEEEHIDESIEELIEYEEDTVEALDEEMFTTVNEEDSFTTTQENYVPKQKKQYAPRNPGGGRQQHMCECGLKFSSNLRLQNHIRVKHEDIQESDLLPCGKCEKKFKIQEYLDLHNRNKHSDSPLKPRKKDPCSICGKILSSHVALKNHEERHRISNQPSDQVKKFICDCCGRSFRLKSYLFNHVHNVHIRSKHICQICSRGFYKRYELEDHIRQYHTMEKPFVCQHEGCTKDFARRKNLMIHQRIHTGERPYPCTHPDCDKTFMHFIDRKRHLIKHTGERPYNCNICLKGCMRKTDLIIHMNLHKTSLDI